MDPFIRAYQDFRSSLENRSEDKTPLVDDLVWCLLAGVPAVPADADDSEDGALRAIEQRVAILKAVFVEMNWEKTDEFLDKGLNAYDEAAFLAKRLLFDAKAK